MTNTTKLNDPKSICFVLSTPFTLNVFLLDHLNALANYFTVTVCVNLNYYPLSKRLDERIKVINIAINRKISPFSDIKTIFELFNILRNNQFDAVHCITPKAILLGTLASYFARIPNRIISFTGQFWANHTGIKRFFFKHLDRLPILLANHYLADSRSQVDYLRSEGLLGRQSIEVFGHGSIAGVDLQRFNLDITARAAKRVEVGDNEKDFIFLFVGRITRDKGITDLLKAFESVRGSRTDIKLWTVGPDEEGIISSMTRLPEGVKWLGSTEYPEDIMKAADLMILPSYREGFGVVIIEAAACGVPTVAYNIVGVNDAIVPNQTGLLVELKNIENLISAMKFLETNKEMLYLMRINGIERVKNFFDSKKITNYWILFYNKMLSNQLSVE
jgi:glycosyltransferase involved in cell wall biosynthesis